MGTDPRNVIVFDSETLRSADDCRFCDQPAASSMGCTGRADGHVAIGWKDFQALGLSIAAYYDYRDERMHVFDRHSLLAFAEMCLARQAQLVTFNGWQFDGPLLAALLQEDHGGDSRALARNFEALVGRGYDVLQAVWAADNAKPYAKGNSLGALSEANGLGSKALNGALAPVLWRQGRHGEVIDYCMGDVYKTKGLFEMACMGTPLRRPGGLAPLRLRIPSVLTPMREAIAAQGGTP